MNTVTIFALVASLNAESQVLGQYGTQIDCELAKSNYNQSPVVLSCEPKEEMGYCTDTHCSALIKQEDGTYKSILVSVKQH